MLRYSISKIFDAPLSFVYSWCTNYTSEDPKIIGASYTRNVIENSKKRAVWIHHYSMDGVPKEGVRIVTMSPPSSWHMDGINEEADRTGDYALKSLGKNKTRLTIVLKIWYKTIEPESVSKLKENLSSDWDKYKAQLERDYASR